MKRLIVNAAHSRCGLLIGDDEDAILDDETSEDNTDFGGLGDIQNEADDDDADGAVVTIRGKLPEPPVWNFHAPEPKTRRPRQRAVANETGLPEPPEWDFSKDRRR